jgi:hypothetical protein
MNYIIYICWAYAFRQSSYLSTVHGLVNNLEDEVGPDNVQHQQHGQQPVEDVVRGKHLHNLRRLDRSAEKEQANILQCCLWLLQFVWV